MLLLDYLVNAVESGYVWLCQSLGIFTAKFLYVASSQRLVHAHLVMRLGEIELITCMKNANYCRYGRQAMEHDTHAVHMLHNVMQEVGVA